MTKPPFTKQIANFAYEKFAKNMGSFLLWIGVAGWIASCVNQTVAIIVNDKIPKDQKKFLIPQEISDGIINTLLFALFTRSFTRFGERMVESGRLATKSLRNFYKDTKISEKTIESLIGTEINALNKKGKAVKKYFNIAELEQITNKSNSDYNAEFSKKYFDFAAGVSFLFSTIGSVISCDFVTPFVRNKFASIRQKQALERDKQKDDPLKPYLPVLPAQNEFGKDKDGYKKQANISVIRIPSSGSMKI